MALLAVSACATTKSEVSPGHAEVPAGPLINGVEGYNQTLAQASNLALVPLEKVNAGEELDEKDRAALVQAVSLYEALEKYAPDNFPLYLGGGQCYQALGRHPEAIKQFETCAFNIPEGKLSADQQKVAGSAYVMMCQSQIQLNKFAEAYESAKLAQKVSPGVESDIAAASALIQLKKREEAKAILLAVIKKDPTQAVAVRLLKLIDGDKAF